MGAGRQEAKMMPAAHPTRPKLTRVAACLALAAVLLLAACANNRDPAASQIAAIESSVQAAQPDAGRYVPEKLAGVQARLAALKADFGRKDYAAVLAAAPGLQVDAQDLVGAASAGKSQVVDELRKQWPAIADSLPQWLEGLQKRVDALGRTHKLPPGVDLAAARSSLDEARALWGKANAAFAASNLEEAIATAQRAKDKATTAAAALHMPLPA
jgi:hypothetical protein